MKTRKRLENGTVEVRDFLFAGKALVTVVKPDADIRFTFKVNESKDHRVYFVSVLTGSDNTSHYSYMGIVSKSSKKFLTTPGSRIHKEAPASKLFAELFESIKFGSLTADNSTYKVYHEGYCGRCGRMLTVPSSIESGFGPECSKHQHS